ncbi:MAG: class I SAM-dependent methyltransferase [Gemmatirosa sp.]|nr:class I SAM-dependent methyltransferase [Gemmatirosa sp.]
MTDPVQAMLETNERQKAFYDTPIEARAGGSRVTAAWFALHDRIRSGWNAAGISEDLVRLHQEWSGDVSGKRVLDLGVYEGTPMTWWLAKRAGEFIAIDLSAPSIARVQRRLSRMPNARAVVADFLSADFTERDFDLIHAASVLHHFQHFDRMLDVLADRLAPGGRVITYDPLETALSVRLTRALYRPFQVDAEWEWPFTRATVRAIERRFDVVELRGVFGRAKWALPLTALSPSGGARVLRWLYDHDMRIARQADRALWRCMHVTMLLARR